MTGPTLGQEARAWRDLAVRAVRIGAAALPDRPPPVRRKRDRSVVTAADLAVHEAVTRYLAANSPDVPVLSEEADVQSPGDTFWLLDPIDGTANYAAGSADYAISVALVLAGEPVVSAMLLPEHRVEYTAAAGLGTLRNGERVRLTARDRDQPIVGMGLTPCGPRLGEQRRLVYRLLSSDCLLREPGCISVGALRVLSGEWDCYLETGIPIWDTVPAALMVTEAGGSAMDLGGRAHGLGSDGVVLCAPGIEEFVSTLMRSTPGIGGRAFPPPDPTV